MTPATLSKHWLLLSFLCLSALGENTIKNRGSVVVVVVVVVVCCCGVDMPVLCHRCSEIVHNLVWRTYWFWSDSVEMASVVA